MLYFSQPSPAFTVLALAHTTANQMANVKHRDVIRDVIVANVQQQHLAAHLVDAISSRPVEEVNDFRQL
jgi:hypothetical protein